MNLTHIKPVLELSKIPILVFSLLMVALGYGIPNIVEFPVAFLKLMLGAALVFSGSAALNHYLERDLDALMIRTQNRPLPKKILLPENVLTFGILQVLSGVLMLLNTCNLWTAFVSLALSFLYVLVYTPLKTVTWLNTTVGAIPGALPPLIGYAAYHGHVYGPIWYWVLLLFIWQHPHFFSVAWIYKEDYQKGGFQMLPVTDPSGHRTFYAIILGTLVLAVSAVLPYVFDYMGTVYLWGMLILSVVLIYKSIRLSVLRTEVMARSYFKATVLYLPVMCVIAFVDKWC